MYRQPFFISGLADAAGRYGAVAALFLQDRLELLALELQEAKLRFVQALLLTCLAVVFSLLGLILLVLGALYIMPSEWKIYGLALAALASLLAGAAAFAGLSRRMRKPMAFEQSLAELKKDARCFSTRN